MAALSEKLLARRVQAAVMRAAYADKMYPKLRAAIRSELEREVREYADSHDAKASKALIKKWKGRIEKTIRPMIVSMAAHGWELAGHEIGHENRTRGKSLVVADRDNFLTRADFSMINQWIESTADSASSTSAKTLEKVFLNAATDGLTPDQIAKNIIAAGLTKSDTRSQMLAHTGAMWAYNEGATQRYQDAGVAVVEWLTADDDMRCPFCAEMNGKRMDTGKPFFSAGDKLSIDEIEMKIPDGARGFDVTHPPLHPNCRCTIIPIFEENS